MLTKYNSGKIIEFKDRLKTLRHNLKTHVEVLKNQINLRVLKPSFETTLFTLDPVEHIHCGL